MERSGKRKKAIGTVQSRYGDVKSDIKERIMKKRTAMIVATLVVGAVLVLSGCASTQTGTERGAASGASPPSRPSLILLSRV